MKHITQVCIYGLMFLTIIGCQKTEEVDIVPAYQRKLIPFVFIGAGDTTITCNAQYTLPIFGDTGSTNAVIAKHANIVLTNQNGQTLLTYSEIDQYYSASLINPIQIGQIYTVVASDSFEQTSGSTIVPQPADVTIAIRFDSAVFLEELTRYIATITYTLNGNEPAYVRILPQLVMEDGWLENMVDEQFTPIKKLMPGQSVTQQFKVVKPYAEAVPFFIQTIVLSCDVHYARYYNALNSSFLEFFPATEPSIDYTNMSNGIGIVASYNFSETEITFIKP